MTFKLKTDAPITPSQGEDLGDDLAGLGRTIMADCKSREVWTDFHKRRVAQIFTLAADALDAGAAASIGHNRADRYEQRAKELREEAADLRHIADSPD